MVVVTFVGVRVVSLVASVTGVAVGVVGVVLVPELEPEPASGDGPGPGAGGLVAVKVVDRASGLVTTL